MKYAEIAAACRNLGATPKKLKKRDVLAEFYKSCPPAKLAKVVNLSLGRPVPKEKDMGVAAELIKRIIAEAYGVGEAEVVEKFKETGDLGDAAAVFAEKRGVRSKGLTVDDVHDKLNELPEISGGGSVERKVDLVAGLLKAAAPEEARYIIRTILGDLRIGVAHGIVRDAIAKAFGREAEDVEKVWNIVHDFGRVAEMSKAGKMKAEMQLFMPLRVQLAEPSPGLKEAFESFKDAAVEQKLDGFRAQIHKSGDKVMIFSRRLEDVTDQFPDIREWSKEGLKSKECIVEGEILAVDPKTREPRPFQQLSRRIQRKYDIERMVEEIPVRIDVFDIVYMDGENLMGRSLRERWRELKRVVRESQGKFKLIEHIEPKDLAEAERFYKAALSQGMEGVIVKNLEAHYRPGRRVGFWLKVKPIMEPLDLVVVGAEWGEGKRAQWLSSYLLGARDPKTGHFLETGKMASGLTEAELEEMTKRLKKLIVEEHGKDVKIKPEVVIEVGYEEIQKSLKYATGYAMRFPRLLRIRDEKAPKDANTVADIERLFKQQKRRK
jgi:DNA ligase-1